MVSQQVQCGLFIISYIYIYIYIYIWIYINGYYNTILNEIYVTRLNAYAIHQRTIIITSGNT